MKILSLFLFVFFVSVAFIPEPAAAADINYQACWPTHGGICKKSISGLPACSLIPPGETSAGACVGDPSYVSGETWQCCVPNTATSSSYPDSAACTADGGIPRGITGCSPGETLKGAIVGPPAGDCCNPATTTGTSGTGTTSTSSTSTGATGFAYQPLEDIPGAKGVSSFPDYVQGIYKFAIWTVGLAALFMLSVGGFIYLSSGGNTATIGKAKTYIWDALIGLVLALLAYLILYVINPDLVNVNLDSFSKVGGSVPTSAITPSTTSSQSIGRPSTGATGCVSTPSDAQPITAGMKTKSQQILDKVGYKSSGGQCNSADGNPIDPSDNFKEQASGQAMTKCYDNCKTATCRAGFYCASKTSMSEQALDVILNTNAALQTKFKLGSIKPFRISSVAGDDHAANSDHYHGKGIDVVAGDGYTVKENGPLAMYYSDILKEFIAQGAVYTGTKAGSFCEDGNGAFVDCLGGAAFPNGGEGDHLHINLP